MNSVLLPNDAAGIFQALPMPDFGLSWAGTNPFGEGFCLGSEAGHVVLTDTRGRQLSRLGQASASGEAINGVALSQNWMAVSTRRDINFIGPLALDTRQLQATVISGGAPEVVVAPSGCFVIPLGRAGLLFAKPWKKECNPGTISNSENDDLNFCRVIALQGEEDTDLIVAAGRRGGVGFSDFREGTKGHVLHTVKFQDLDIVDICSIATPQKPRAVVAAARDGALVLFDDILTDMSPVTLRFNAIKGAVYRILSARGDVYVLTSKGLFALFRLADQFCSGLMPGGFTTYVLCLPIAAADANMVDQKWLLATGTDELFKFDIQKMPRSPDECGISNGVAAPWAEPTAPTRVEALPVWRESGFEQNLEQFAAAC